MFCTAFPGRDYTAVNSVMILLSQNQLSQCMRIDITSDEDLEAEENFAVVIAEVDDSIELTVLPAVVLIIIKGKFMIYRIG